MTRYGQEVESGFVDEETRVDYVRNMKNFDVCSVYKRTSVRVKVYNSKEEMVELLTFTRLLEEKRHAGTLAMGDLDSLLQHSFVVEYPKRDVDGGYFVIRSITEVV